jgi:hypothetical protein
MAPAMAAAAHRKETVMSIQPDDEQRAATAPQALYVAGGSDPRRRAEAGLIREAESAAAGHRWLTIEVGAAVLPDDAEQLALLNQVRAAAERTGRLRSVSRGTDRLVIEVGPAGAAGELAADDVLTPLELLAHELNPGSWSIHRSAG